MSDIATVLGTLAGPLPPVEHRGKTHRPRLITQVEKAAFVSWLKERAKAELAVFRDFPEEYEARKAALFAAFDAGEYGFYGPVAAAARKTPEGLLRMVELAFGCPEHEALVLVGECPAAMAAFGEVLRESFPAAPPGAAEGPGPNPPAP